MSVMTCSMSGQFKCQTVQMSECHDPSHAFAAVHSSYPLIYLHNVYKSGMRSRSRSRSRRSRHILVGAGAGAAEMVCSEPEPEPEP